MKKLKINGVDKISAPPYKRDIAKGTIEDKKDEIESYFKNFKEEMMDVALADTIFFSKGYIHSARCRAQHLAATLLNKTIIYEE